LIGYSHRSRSALHCGSENGSDDAPADGGETALATPVARLGVVEQDGINVLGPPDLWMLSTLLDHV